MGGSRGILHKTEDKIGYVWSLLLSASISTSPLRGGCEAQTQTHCLLKYI